MIIESVFIMFNFLFVDWTESASREIKEICTGEPGNRLIQMYTDVYPVATVWTQEHWSFITIHLIENILKDWMKTQAKW